MDELRREVIEAFDKGQAELLNLSGVRERIVRQALAARETRRDSSMQLAAGLAVVLIAAVVIATFAYVRYGSQPSHESPPRPSASPTPLSQPLSVSADTPVILYQDPANSDQIDGMTWDGKRSGRVDWSVGLGASNPSANQFATTTEITDRSGRVLGTGTFGMKFFTGTWADDGLHFCLMVPLDSLGANGVPATLQLVTPGSKPHSVAKVGKLYEQAILRVAACSVRNDRAVVVQGFGNSVATAQYWVVQLSTGRILWTHRFDTSHPVTVVASPDAQYIAEAAETPVRPTTVIYGADGSLLVRLSAHVEGFSWDGSIVVTDNGYGSGKVSAVRWGNGTDTGLQALLWSAPAGYALTRILAQPDGSSLAIWITTLAQQSSGPTQADLYVVASDGKVLAHIRYPPQ